MDVNPWSTYVMYLMTGLALTPILKTQTPSPMFSLKLATLFLHRDKIFPQVGLTFTEAGQQFSKPIGFTKLQSKLDATNTLAYFSNMSRHSLVECRWYGLQSFGWKIIIKYVVIKQVFASHQSWLLYTNEHMNSYCWASWWLAATFREGHLPIGKGGGLLMTGVTEILLVRSSSPLSFLGLVEVRDDTKTNKQMQVWMNAPQSQIHNPTPQ